MVFEWVRQLLEGMEGTEAEEEALIGDVLVFNRKMVKMLKGLG